MNVYFANRKNPVEFQVIHRRSRLQDRIFLYFTVVTLGLALLAAIRLAQLD